MNGRSTACSAYKSIMLVVTLATIAGTIWLYIVVPKGFFPTEDTGYVIGITEANTDIAFPGDGRRISARSPTSCAPTRRSPTSIPPSAPAGPTRVANSGRMLVALKPRDERGSLQSKSSRGCGKSANVVPGIADLFPADPEHQSRRQAGQEPVSIHAAVQRHRGVVSRRARIARQDRQDCRACSTSPPISTSRIRRSRSMSIAKNRRSMASPSTRCARSSITPSARARSPPSTRRQTTIRSFLETKPEFQSSPNDLDTRLSEDHKRHRGAALGGHPFRAHGRTAAGQPPGPAAGGDHLVQSAARLLARPGGRRDSASWNATTACRRPSPPASRAPRRCSRIHCAGRAF